MGKKDRYGHDRTMVIAVIVLFLFCIAISTLGYWKIKSVDRRIMESEENMEEMKVHMKLSEGLAEQAEYLKAIEFLENETVKYREFVQEQQEYLIWLLGVVGTAFLALMAFLGYESRKKISDIFQEKYVEQVEDEIAGFIGGASQRKYLLRCIKKEKQAKEKKILFLNQTEKNDNIEKVYTFLERCGYRVAEKAVKGSLKEERIRNMAKKYGLIIYQVNQAEYQKKRNPDESGNENNAEENERNFIKIARICDERKIHVIFFCAGGNRIELEKCSNPFYVSSVNFAATLLERINSVLYLQE